MKCHNCQRVVTRKSKFCPHCGEPVIPKSVPRQKEQKPKTLIGYAVVLAIACMIFGFVIAKFSESSEAPVQRNFRTAPNIVATTSSQILEIAKEFMCPCGKCDDVLDKCTCEHKSGALEVKAFISQQLQNGHKKPHIVEMVQQKFSAKRNESVTLFEFDQKLN